MIELRKITEDNVKACMNLSVEEEQKAFVASNTNSLIDAYVALNNDEPAKTYAIYANDSMVGFAMIGYFNEKYGPVDGEFYYLWRFMIDKAHQGKGYGKMAMEKIVEEVKEKPFGNSNYFVTSIEPSNIGARKLYNSFGFKETGMFEEKEEVLVFEM
ncbi:MAG: GNAT family N-acetyltransferase [Streptococcaceae bacterium]|jgi:diamine N-acetyltransferase|nr:GNAT family N-acetyltransferase [Streptococcaceae bacterium]